MMIQLHIKLNGVRSKGRAEAIAEAAADHLKETFNDDNSLGLIVYKVIEKDSRS